MGLCIGVTPYRECTVVRRISLFFLIALTQRKAGHAHYRLAKPQPILALPYTEYVTFVTYLGILSQGFDIFSISLLSLTLHLFRRNLQTILFIFIISWQLSMFQLCLQTIILIFIKNKECTLEDEICEPWRRKLCLLL